MEPANKPYLKQKIQGLGYLIVVYRIAKITKKSIKKTAEIYQRYFQTQTFAKRFHSPIGTMEPTNQSIILTNTNLSKLLKKIIKAD